MPGVTVLCLIWLAALTLLVRLQSKHQELMVESYACQHLEISLLIKETALLREELIKIKGHLYGPELSNITFDTYTIGRLDFGDTNII